MALAIFDLDNTLLGGDSDHAWGEFLVTQGIVDGEHYQQANDRFYEQYQRGEMDIFEFLEFALKPLAQHSLEQLQAWHQQFMQQVIEPMILAKGEALLAEHRAAGDFLLIITATNRFVTGPIAERLGVDAIIATDPELVDGRYTGRVAGTPCYQGGKVTRLESWLQENPYSLEGSHFYSDSCNDLPLLEMVERAVAVDPDDKLARIAAEREWEIISLR